jgi:hypothetical protein
MTDETTRQKLAIGHGLFLLACALLIGFAAGRSVADAAGAIGPESSTKPFAQLQAEERVWIFVAMALLALFVFAAFRFLLLLGHRVVSLLGQVETRPNLWVAVMIIACGVPCLLSAVALQWHESSVSATVSASLPPVRAKTSFMVPVTTLGVLLAGVAVTAVGIWSSIPPRRSLVSTAQMGSEGAEGSPNHPGVQVGK